MARLATVRRHLDDAPKIALAVPGVVDLKRYGTWSEATGSVSAAAKTTTLVA